MAADFPGGIARGVHAVHRTDIIVRRAVGTLQTVDERPRWVAGLPSMLQEGPPAILFGVLLGLVMFRHRTAASFHLSMQIAMCCVIGAKFAEATWIGQALSSLVSAMVVSVILAQFLAAPAAPLRFLQRWSIAIATPLLLLNCDLEAACGKESRRLVLVFAIGASGVLLGSILSSVLLKRALLSTCRNGATTAGVVSALAAKNIGSGMNFIAVAEVLRVPADVFGLALVADNILGLLYFPLISMLMPAPTTPQPLAGSDMGEAASAPPSGKAGSTLRWGQAFAAAVASACIAFSTAAVLPSGEALIVSSLLTVAVATVFASRWSKWTVLAAAGSGLAQPLVHIYSGTVGFSIGRITVDTVSRCIPLLGLNLGVYVLHLSLALVAANVFGFKRQEVMIASAACIGGPAIASALALSKGYVELAQRAVLVGSVGNAFGTVLGVGLSRVLKLML